MDVLNELSYTLEDMLEPLSKKEDISPTELDNVYKATKTLYYIETIKAMKEYGEDSSYNYPGVVYRTSYDGDHDGRYSERRGRSSRGRYSRKGYSMDGTKEEMLYKLERMMDEASSEPERQTIRDCIRRIETE